MDVAELWDKIQNKGVNMEPLIRHTVVWKIDAWANSPQKAAEIALEIQRDSESTATIFEVTPDNGETVTVDTLES